MSYFPMMVNLEGVRVLVVGGGEEGRKKVEILSSFGAKITLIAKNAADEAVELADRFLERGFEDQDLEEEFGFVVAATDDRILNQRIRWIMKEKGISSLEELFDGVELGGVSTFLGSGEQSDMSLFI